MEFESCERLIKKLSYTWSEYTGILQKELEAEGFYAYVKAKNNWDEERPFIPYLQAIVWNEMKCYSRKFYQKPSIDDVKLLKPIDTNNPEKEAIFNDLIENLSQESKEMIRIILDSPIEMIDLVPKRMGALSKEIISKYFNKYLGWTYKNIRKCFAEIAMIWS